jgi:hypothetical protein
MSEINLCESSEYMQENFEELAENIKTRTVIFELEGFFKSKLTKTNIIFYLLKCFNKISL